MMTCVDTAGRACRIQAPVHSNVVRTRSLNDQKLGTAKSDVELGRCGDHMPTARRVD